MIDEMVDQSHLVRIAPGIYEDMGGHIISDTTAIDYGYIEDFLNDHDDEHYVKRVNKLRYKWRLIAHTISFCH